MATQGLDPIKWAESFEAWYPHSSEDPQMAIPGPARQKTGAVGALAPSNSDYGVALLLGVGLTLALFGVVTVYDKKRGAWRR